MIGYGLGYVIMLVINLYEDDDDGDDDDDMTYKSFPGYLKTVFLVLLCV